MHAFGDEKIDYLQRKSDNYWIKHAFRIHVTKKYRPKAMI
jgi:hypothetical protein